MQGAVIYKGPSRLDGVAIVAILVGLGRPSTNRDTGPMSQLYIERDGMLPSVAQAKDLDRCICGDCPLRGPKGGCYVVKVHGSNAVMRTYLEGGYPTMAPRDAGRLSRLKGLAARLGADGDPAALPISVLESFTKAAQHWTGYTHQWRRFPSLKRYCMASVESPKAAAEAQAKGWATFRILSRQDRPQKALGEIECPKSISSATCASCLICDGQSGSVAILGHGPLTPKRNR